MFGTRLLHLFLLIALIIGGSLQSLPALGLAAGMVQASAASTVAEPGTTEANITLAYAARLAESPKPTDRETSHVAFPATVDLQGDEPKQSSAKGGPAGKPGPALCPAASGAGSRKLSQAPPRFVHLLP